MKLSIPKPCYEKWETMSPDEKGRFCSVCSKTVRDFTVASDEEIINVFSGSSESICGKFYESQLNRSLQYSYLNSVFLKFAAGFILTTGGWVSIHAQQNIPNDTLKVEEINEVVFPEFSRQKNQNMMVGTFTVVPEYALNAKENKPEEILSKLQGLAVNPIPSDISGKQQMKIGRANPSLGEDQNPLVVMNGKIISLKDLQKVDPNSIKTINILKDSTATVVYGSQARNGVIIVTTKKKWKIKK